MITWGTKVSAQARISVFLFDWNAGGARGAGSGPGRRRLRTLSPDGRIMPGLGGKRVLFRAQPDEFGFQVA